MIYRSALLETRKIRLSTRNAFRQPAFPLVCRQIRQEAIGIYYGENHFVYLICNYDPVFACRSRYLMTRYTPLFAPKVSMQFAGVPNWPNLLKWLEEAYHHRAFNYAKKGGVVPVSKENTTRITLEGAFTTMRHLREGGNGWEIIKEVLGVQHRMLVYLDERWA